jgi:hypothetical protein
LIEQLQMLPAGSESNPARAETFRDAHAHREPQSTRPLVRGVLGFRIRTAPKKKYSIIKERPNPPTRAAASETTSSPERGSRARKSKT